MRTGQGQVEEEGFLFRRIFDEFSRFSGKVPQAFDVLKVRSCWSRSVKGFGVSCNFRTETVPEINIGEHVQRCRDNEGLFETQCIRSSFDWLGVVNVPASSFGRAIDCFACFAIGQLLPTQPQVPFPNNAGVVTLFFQKGSNGRAAFWDQGFVQPKENGFLESGTPVVAAREYTIACGCADGGSGVSIGKPDALFGNAVNMGSRCQAAREGGVAVTLIIGKDENEVGL